MSEAWTPQAMDRLLERKARLVAFLERRLGNRADAEDLLQTAFLKLLAWEGRLRDDDKLIPWFYQLLRNLLISTYRQRAAQHRLTGRLAAESITAAPIDEELFDEACTCVNDVIASLGIRYADIIRRVYLEEQSLAAVARELRITPNNAAVRLHRARRALVEGLRLMCGVCLEHRCLDCPCRPAVTGQDAVTSPPPSGRVPQ